MKKLLNIILSAMILVFSACSQKQPTEEKANVIDTIPVMVMQIQKCSRLYTAEAHVHKIITHDDQLNLKGSFMKKDFNIHIPGSNRKVAIPMDATIKAYVDFEGFSQKNVSRKGDKIEIILPDPKLVLTSSKIDHKAVKQYVSLTRSNFTDAELTKLEQQGRQSIINDIPNIDLMEQAQFSAANTLIPMLIDMGFKEENIKISFRKKFTLQDLKGFISNGLSDKTTIEKKNAPDQVSK
ncbi:DUF4230 domain-containing protein [Segatella copri]|uniref:DUF4230 domain-containing protein n=1 Tax=Segatella copri TaxID=165179 RepID=UPI001C4812F4|nr:DUF4230 domain-containing protein [Segatella copri]WOZ84955.1 DUF4230 domain-containing protein [Segatella copri]